MILKILAPIFLGNFFFMLLSLYKIRRSQKKVELICNWAFPLGAFIWEDLLVFSLFNLLGVLIVYFAQDLRWGLLLLILFWIVRNLGEMIYWLLQQFGQPTEYPHNQFFNFRLLKMFLGELSNQQCFILMQITHQVLLVFFLAAGIWLLRNWSNIPPWF